MKKISIVVVLLVGALTFSMCGKKAAAPGEAGNRVLAELNGEPITENDVRESLGNRIKKLEMDLFEAQEDGVLQIVEDRLIAAEAKRRGVSNEALLKEEVIDKVQVSDEEVRGYYESRKDSFQGQDFETAKGRIYGFLFQNAQRSLRSQLVNQLKKSAQVTMHVKAPRIDIEVGNAPTLGDKGAPIMLVEFSDYQCPFCKRAQSVTQQLRQDYDGKIFYVFKDFPLSFHKESQKAHEAAYCADDQGKYWDYNQKLWDNQRALNLPELKKYAQELGLNTQSFSTCLESGKHSARVQAGLQQGSEVGVSGTPAFFINGKMISGARPYESFKEIIDRELERSDS